MTGATVTNQRIAKAAFSPLEKVYEDVYIYINPQGSYFNNSA